MLEFPFDEPLVSLNEPLEEIVRFLVCGYGRQFTQSQRGHPGCTSGDQKLATTCIGHGGFLVSREESRPEK